MNFSRTFFEMLVFLGERDGWRPEDMLTLMAGECSLVSVRNRFGYEGLTQIGPSELHNLGWDPVAMGAFWKALPEVQLPYSAAYFAEWKRRMAIPAWESAGHLWLCNLAPAHLKRAGGVVYSNLTEHAQYQANRWLDTNRDGVITRDELDVALRTAVSRCQARYDAVIAALNDVRVATSGVVCV